MNREESTPDFWDIVGVDYPEEAVAGRALDHARQLEKVGDTQSFGPQPEVNDSPDQSGDISNASRDHNIAAYFLHGMGTEESLIAYLQREYDLTEQEAENAIDIAIGEFGEVTGYGDEA